MPNESINYSAAIAASLADVLERHLLREDGQEDVAFVLYRPSTGSSRFSAVLGEAILPLDGDRIVHGNVEFTPRYLERVLSMAGRQKMGIALIHSHPKPAHGWQGLSTDDSDAEARIAGAVRAVSGLPLVGLTLAGDRTYSGRAWSRVAEWQYEAFWMENVRVVGPQLRVSNNPDQKPELPIRAELQRSVGVWGSKMQYTLSQLRVGIVGLGSVGSLVCEALARMGATSLVLLDFDIIKDHNLDRITGAAQSDVGLLKVDVACRNAQASSTQSAIAVKPKSLSICEDSGHEQALDCDVIFSCVDRHWPRMVLNQLSYAHLIPVIDGGILVRLRGDRLIGADWHVHTVGPERSCLECMDAFDASMVGLEVSGQADDPSYLLQLDPTHPLLRHENVFPFSMNVASLELLQLAAMIRGIVPDLGDQNYHFASGTLDVTSSECKPNCLYRPVTGLADAARRLTGVDPARRVLEGASV